MHFCSVFFDLFAFLHFWTVAICAVFEGFYSCSFVMFFLQSCIRPFTELSFISFLQLLSMCFLSIKYPMIALSIINLTALFTSCNWLTHVGVMSKNCIVFILRKTVCFVLHWLAIIESILVFASIECNTVVLALYPAASKTEIGF